MLCSMCPPVEGSLLAPVKLCIAVFHRYSRLGSWGLIESMAVFLGASCMPVGVALFFLPCP